MPVIADDVGLASDAGHRADDVGTGPEEAGDLVGRVDEGERAHAGEVLPERLGQHQREVAEPGHRAAHVAEHDQFGLVHLPRPVVGRHRDTAGAQRGAHRLPEVQPAFAAQPPTGGQADREPAGQRRHRPPLLG